eukprot:Skav234708  [mRNA]  locus=scaffold634:15491:25238:+ [translate_table: standard]
MSLPDGLLQRRRSSVRNSLFEGRRPSVTMDRRPSDADGGPMERRHSQHKTRKGPVPQALMGAGFGDVRCRVEKAGYAGDVYLLFQRLDTDNSGKLTLDEIDEEAAKLWLAFKPLDIGRKRISSFAVGSLTGRKDKRNGCGRGTSAAQQGCRVALHNEEYVRPEMLKWMAVGKEEHREKEELKKLAMKAVHAVKIRERQMLAQVAGQQDFKACFLEAQVRRQSAGGLATSLRSPRLDERQPQPGRELLWGPAGDRRSFITDKFGTAEDAFRAMDKAKNNSGRLSERDFIEECQKQLQHKRGLICSHELTLVVYRFLIINCWHDFAGSLDKPFRRMKPQQTFQGLVQEPARQGIVSLLPWGCGIAMAQGGAGLLSFKAFRFFRLRYQR